jgi:hypothetical protein
MIQASPPVAGAAPVPWPTTPSAKSSAWSKPPSGCLLPIGIGPEIERLAVPIVTDHGGISLQECLTPVLVVSGGSSRAPAAAITEISWKGLRCNLEVSGGTAGMTADLRRDAAGERRLK